MDIKQINWKRVIIIAGSFIAFAIGSGFSTGQETLQFFGAFGFKSFLSVVVFFILLSYINCNFFEAGRIGQFEKGSQVFNYFCGKYVGKFFDYFTVLFVFMSYFVMIAGAGANFNQQFGIPNAVGAIIMAIAAGVTVVFGLNKLVEIIGTIGPFIIILAVTASILGVIYGKTGIIEGNRILPKMNVMAAGPNWFLAVLSYTGFGMLWFASFFATIGKDEKNPNDARLGIILGAGVFAATIIIVVLALLANIEFVAHSQIPLLLIINNISHTMATVYSVVIFLAIYSTACPLLWTVSSRVSKEGTTKYKIITMVLAIIGCAIGLWIPFNKLLNYVYAINGYIGFILFAFIVVRNVRSLLSRKA
ncbi:MAG TPA: hypothetical protein PK033_14420 [Acetivibrio sp.]|nr:hypothetical protein [Acetivibrio sp.]